MCIQWSDRQMPCKRLQRSYRPSANLLTLMPTGTTEYIAAGDSQAAVPFPTEIGRDFDLQWKTASGLSYLLLQLAVMAGKRAFRRRAVGRHWYGLAQAWGSTTYDWTLGQILPRSREEGCQQNLTEALSKRRHGFTVRENLPWKNTHMGLPEVESGHTDT